MAKTRDTVQELPAQDVGFLFGTMFDLTTLPKELKHTGKVAKGEFKIVAHFPAIHAKNGTEAAYLARHRTFRGGLYATYQDGPYKIDEVNWDATNRAGVHMVTMTKYGQVVEFPSQPSKTMPGSLKLMVQELVESLKTPGFIIRCSGLGGALEPKKGTTDEYNVILLNGDVKCPKKLANHVPAKYHAEDESIFLAQTGPWCGNAEDYQKPPWIKGPGRKTRAMRSAKKQKNIELREKRNAEQMTQMGDSFFPVIPNTGGGDSALGSGRGVPQWYGAEYEGEDSGTLMTFGEINYDYEYEDPSDGPLDKYDVVGIMEAVENFIGDSGKGEGRDSFTYDTEDNEVIEVYLTWENSYEGINSAEEDVSMSAEGDEQIKLFYAECGDCGRPATHSARGGTMNRCDRCWPGEEFEAPMPFYSPSKGDVDRVQKAIRSRHQGIRFKGSPTYLTERKDGSNKYHVFQMTNRGGFNGYGRIGHTMSLFGPMSQQQYQSKLRSKMRKGYRETGF